ncbi:MAG TPA: hypothetical protein VN207_09440 [Ktedonobacteraceae bacterium]|nr:hypothetical protein [Ktedonobacteraceae bacterium]
MDINVLIGNNISFSKIPFKSPKPKKLRETSQIISNSTNSYTYPYSTRESEGVIESPPEHTTPSSSDLDIKHLVDLMMSEPQDGIGFAQTAGIIEERISPDND